MSEQEYQDHQALTQRMCRIGYKLLVLSGKGGVGKSTVAANLAITLALAGKQIDLFKTGEGEALAREMEVAYLGRIPIDPQIVVCGDDGIPYVHRFADSPAAQAFAMVVERVIAASQPQQTQFQSSNTEGDNS